MTTREHSRVRDAALRRLSDMNRILVIGSMVLAGLLTDVAAHAFPGRSPALLKRAAERAATTARRHSQSTSRCLVCAPGHKAAHANGASSSQGTGSATPPAASSAPPPASQPAPAPAPAPAPVVSGGS